MPLLTNLWVNNIQSQIRQEGIHRLYSNPTIYLARTLYAIHSPTWMDMKLFQKLELHCLISQDWRGLELLEYMEERTLPDKDSLIRAFHNHLQGREALKSLRLITPRPPSDLERQIVSQLTKCWNEEVSFLPPCQRNLFMIESSFLIIQERQPEEENIVER